MRQKLCWVFHTLTTSKNSFTREKVMSFAEVLMPVSVCQNLNNRNYLRNNYCLWRKETPPRRFFKGSEWCLDLPKLLDWPYDWLSIVYVPFSKVYQGCALAVPRPKLPTFVFGWSTTQVTTLWDKWYTLYYYRKTYFLHNNEVLGTPDLIVESLFAPCDFS